MHVQLIQQFVKFLFKRHTSICSVYLIYSVCNIWGIHCWIFERRYPLNRTFCYLAAYFINGPRSILVQFNKNKKMKLRKMNPLPSLFFWLSYIQFYRLQIGQWNSNTNMCQFLKISESARQRLKLAKLKYLYISIQFLNC